MGLSPIPIQAFVLETRMCGLELGVALQGHRTRQWWNWGPEGGGLSGRAASPSPRLAEASPAVRVGARVRGRRLAPHSGDPRVARVSPLPFALRALALPPSPADKPPVPPNQVRLLLHAWAAELDQLPLMACRPVPLPGSGRGGGEAKTRTMSGKGALLPQCRPFHSF